MNYSIEHLKIAYYFGLAQLRFDQVLEQFILFQGTVVNGQVSGTASLGVGSAEADFNGLQLDIQSVPEPSTCAMMFAGTILLALLGNRKPFSCGHEEKAVRQQ